jgi:hypothetical protein
MADIIDAKNKFLIDPDNVEVKDSGIFECKDRPVPYVQRWGIQCPSCGEHMDYEPEESEPGRFVMDPAEWPVCECGCMFEPAAVWVRTRGSDPRT